MAEVQTVSAEIELLQGVYAAFNRRDIESVLAKMQTTSIGQTGWKAAA